MDAILIIIMVLVPASAFGYTILQPMAYAIHGIRLPVRFYISDFFSLSFLVAIPLVFITFIRKLHGDSIIIGIFGSILVGMFAYIWWRGATFLSGIGVLQTGRRCFFLGILLPIAILGSVIVVPVLLGITLYVINAGFAHLSTSEVALWIMSLTAPFVAWCCRIGTFWVLADPNIPKKETSLEISAKQP